MCVKVPTAKAGVEDQGSGLVHSVHVACRLKGSLTAGAVAMAFSLDRRRSALFSLHGVLIAPSWKVGSNSYTAAVLDRVLPTACKHVLRQSYQSPPPGERSLSFSHRQSIHPSS